MGAWARQVQTGRPMTEEEELDIFGGPNGENRAILKQYFDVRAKRERERT